MKKKSINKGIQNLATGISRLRFSFLNLTLVGIFVIALTGCEKQPGFDRLNDISGNYTITRATVLKSDNVTDSVSFTNFGSMSISSCKKNSTQNCPGDYKVGGETVSLKVSYLFGVEGNILQLAPDQVIKISGWQLFGQYRIIEESDSRLILQSGSKVVFNDKPTGRVVLELNK